MIACTSAGSIATRSSYSFCLYGATSASSGACAAARRFCASSSALLCAMISAGFASITFLITSGSNSAFMA